MKKYEILFLGLFFGMLIGSLVNIIYTFIIVSIGSLALCTINFVNYIIAKKDVKAINLQLLKNKL